MIATARTLGSQSQVNVADPGNGGIAGNQSNPRITVLPDGRFVVVYQSDYWGNSTDIDPKVMIFNADGSLFTPTLITPYRPSGLQTTPVVAPRADGGFAVVFTDTLHRDGTVDASGTNIDYIPVMPPASPATRSQSPISTISRAPRPMTRCCIRQWRPCRTR